MLNSVYSQITGIIDANYRWDVNGDYIEVDTSAIPSLVQFCCNAADAFTGDETSNVSCVRCTTRTLKQQITPICLTMTSTTYLLETLPVFSLLNLIIF